ncbi:MAG: hypothetical protein JWO86_1044 [Myxococcaceae bacterium]|jgi:hypothetical protein|nr:hypothetical protein [Myxococcaceae bacterium]
MSELVTVKRCIQALLAICCAGTVHCASSRTAYDTPEDAGPPPVGALQDAATEAAVPTGDCSEENKQIYVLTSGQKKLLRFDPAALTFTTIGDLACPTSADTFSMAVDRQGNAWVEYTDGSLFLVSTKDAHCTQTPFRGNQNQFRTFGMGFSKDANAANETLFVEGEALGSIDTKTYELSLIGPTGLGISELTGTGNGLLYAFAANSGRVVRLDKTTGKIEQTYRTAAIGVEVSWAFAHWGGDFWLFVGGASSSVTRYSPATDTSTVVIPDAGYVIVGAGSSTCAPFAPPH